MPVSPSQGSRRTSSAQDVKIHHDGHCVDTCCFTMNHIVAATRTSRSFVKRTLKRPFASLPNSLVDPPTLALVPPGRCQFTLDFQKVPLLELFPVSETSSVFRFGLPDPSSPLNLSTCACVLARARIGDDFVVRPYTPISTNAQVGHFDLLVKNYKSHGTMSRHLCTLAPGDFVEVQHLEGNVKIQAPFAEQHIGMLVGGTGISPMLQALHAILGDPASTTKVSMLYGSKISSDILGHKVLENWCESHGNRLSVTHVLSHEDANSDWRGKRGYVDEELIKSCLPPPSLGEDVILFVCGPPPMYDALCGPREEKQLSGLLAQVGYESFQVYKF